MGLTAAVRVLVTGGAGFIGSHTCKALAAAGHIPVTVDDLSTGHASVVRYGPFEQGDILDRARLDDVFRRHQPEAVVHFAARIAVAESVSDPAAYYRTNVTGSLTLVEAARASGVNRLVFSSTAAVYGAPEYTPLDEKHPLRPTNPYGQTKLVVEQALRTFDEAYGFTSVSLRYFNAAGADPDAELAEAHEPETHLIPLVLRAAAGKLPAITICGSDFDTPDGTCLRDYVHVADLADAHVLALDYLARGGGSDVFNLGNGRGVSVREVIDAVRDVTGRSFPVNVGPRRSGDVAALVAAAVRAQATLGWAPRYPRVETQIEHGWRAMQALGG